jgi:hypothetical protein
MTMMTTIRIAAALIALAGAAAPAQAQSVAEVVNFLVTNHSVATGNLDRDAAAADATSQTISRALLASLATLPVTTSSGGFVYRFNPELGTLERGSSSFGPFFVERAASAGRGTMSIGVTLQHFRFDSLDGRRLRNGSLVTTANQFVDEPEPYDVDRLMLDIDADVATLHGSAGLTDRIELGFAAPVVLLRVNGSRVNEYRGNVFTQAQASATAFGLADTVLRAKVTLFEDGGTGLAGAVDARLPTGREADLLGAGALSWKVSAIGSMEGPMVSSHANAGVTFGGLARELTVAGAVSAAATSRLTLTGEVVGRWMDTAGGITSTQVPHPWLSGVRTLRLLPDGSSLTMISAAPGVKWNLTDTWVLVGHAAMPVTGGGLTARITPFVGLDYAVER